MSILDLDNLSTWRDQYLQFIKSDELWPTIQDILSQKDDEDLLSFLNVLRHDIANTARLELKALHQRGCDYFETVYSHVVAYHACRPISVKSYLEKGILPSNTTDIVEQATLLFGDRNAVADAEKGIAKEGNYVQHNHGKIGLLFCSRDVSSHSSYLTHHGGEFLHLIANKIGGGAEQKLAGIGTPRIFRCALPVSWLDRFTTVPVKNIYAIAPLVGILSSIRWPKEWEMSSQGGGFMLVRPVPKELILDVIDMTP